MARIFDFEFMLSDLPCPHSQIEEMLYEDLRPHFVVYHPPNCLICTFYNGGAVGIFVRETIRKADCWIFARPTPAPVLLREVEYLCLVRGVAQAVFCSLERRGLRVEYLQGNIEW